MINREVRNCDDNDNEKRRNRREKKIKQTKKTRWNAHEKVSTNDGIHQENVHKQYNNCRGIYNIQYRGNLW